MTTPKKTSAARKPPTPVQGEVTALHRKSGWAWKWRSPKGTEHVGPARFPTEKAALAEGRKFARRSAVVQGGAE